MIVRRAGHLVAIVLSLDACDAVPTLTFLSAGDDATSPPGDGGLPADGGPGGPEASCPQAPPAGATACCGVIACAGDCDAHCGDCQSKCTTVQACCARSGGVSCHDPSFVCN